MSRPRTRSQILREVEELAEDAMELRPEFTDEEARGFIWESFPELYEEFRKAAPEPPVQPVAKAQAPTSVADVIADAVDAEASRRAWTEWPNMSIEQLRAEIWLSNEGQSLYGLSKARGHEDYHQARIRKSAGEQGAWRVLEEWRR